MVENSDISWYFIEMTIVYVDICPVVNAAADF